MLSEEYFFFFKKKNYIYIQKWIHTSLPSEIIILYYGIYQKAILVCTHLLMLINVD